MNYTDWYTDRLTVYRVKPVLDGALTRHERVRLAEDVPCRIYHNSAHGPRMQSTAAYFRGEDRLACATVRARKSWPAAMTRTYSRGMSC